MNKLFFSLTMMSLVLFSCRPDDEKPTTTVNIPDTYTFERNGDTTVSFSGQTARLGMLSEMASLMKGSSNWPISEAQLTNMYTNTNNPFSGSELNSSGKQLRSKTAASAMYFANNSVVQAGIREFFDDILADFADLSTEGNQTASAGNAGIISDGRLVDEYGIEYVQVFEKSLMGACLLDQTLNNYLSPLQLEKDNYLEENNNDLVVEGKNYTNMEHKWDEAYGYIFGQEDSFWHKYLIRVNDIVAFSTILEDVDLAFRTGRASIVAKNYSLRDEQVAILREKLSLVVAVRAIYYLQEGKAMLIPNTQEAFHDLSEGIGFILSLAYTQNPGTNQPYFNLTQVEEFLENLTSGTNGLWDVDTVSSQADIISNAIASAFGITINQVMN